MWVNPEMFIAAESSILARWKAANMRTGWGSLSLIGMVGAISDDAC